ncbi:hypothetical protein BLNAU_2839 [Blattamonas nauphoetae]|uniref:VHS domain-containing protein n=1 Tax=Blattamonas nauphoetae TaxID=2049346 RepID=A0ABQ9YF17_9EUKA|nr:hypothetical protein BLNAU_2839 [Blattamonas nauphoetae]
MKPTGIPVSGIELETIVNFTNRGASDSEKIVKSLIIHFGSSSVDVRLKAANAIIACLDRATPPSSMEVQDKLDWATYQELGRTILNKMYEKQNRTSNLAAPPPVDPHMSPEVIGSSNRSYEGIGSSAGPSSGSQSSSLLGSLGNAFRGGSQSIGTNDRIDTSFQLSSEIDPRMLSSDAPMNHRPLQTSTYTPNYEANDTVSANTQVTDGKKELNVLSELCSSSGIGVSPPKAQLQQFLEQAVSMDMNHVSHILATLVKHEAVNVRSKAFSVIAALLEDSFLERRPDTITYFNKQKKIIKEHGKKVTNSSVKAKVRQIFKKLQIEDDISTPKPSQSYPIQESLSGLDIGSTTNEFFFLAQTSQVDDDPFGLNSNFTKPPTSSTIPTQNDITMQFFSTPSQPSPTPPQQHNPQLNPSSSVDDIMASFSQSFGTPQTQSQGQYGQYHQGSSVSDVFQFTQPQHQSAPFPPQQPPQNQTFSFTDIKTDPVQKQTQDSASAFDFMNSDKTDAFSFVDDLLNKP